MDTLIREKIVEAINACQNSYRVDLYIDILKRIKKDNAFTPVTMVAFGDFYGFRYAGLGVNWQKRYF